MIINLIALYKALGGGWEVRCQGFALESIVQDPRMIEMSAPSRATDLTAPDVEEVVGSIDASAPEPDELSPTPIQQ